MTKKSVIIVYGFNLILLIVIGYLLFSGNNVSDTDPQKGYLQSNRIQINEAELVKCDNRGFKSYCDQGGKRIKTEFWSTGGYSLYAYDDAGNHIKKEYYDANGILEWYYYYEYDAESRLVKKENYDTYGNLEGYDEYAYDNAGEQIQGRYDSDGNFLVKSYDENWGDWGDIGRALLILAGMYIVGTPVLIGLGFLLKILVLDGLDSPRYRRYDQYKSRSRRNK